MIVKKIDIKKCFNHKGRGDFSHNIHLSNNILYKSTKKE